MATKSMEVRNRGLVTALRYRGREGMWAWLLHRATGLGVLFFLIIHVIETAAVVYSPEFYDEALQIYKNPFFRFAELLIFFSVLFHAVNGSRIVIQDFWPYLMERQRQLTWAAGIVVLLVMVPVTWIMVAPVFGLAEEPGLERHLERCVERTQAPACLEVVE
ncbi:MAG: succinate dehydrogenase, cytochrome b556 subunit [Gemmatimonas sp.]|nr:succinate dehydrogenase, cytochrome b556 subunit [Gemmatimonas sp.]